ncbi:MAG: diacylglycerol O-acyltransferase / wax synthase [Frankiaceae bacterium]|nr:diacylglycerol O-acyltransferase / wax synthase [Frankiaceae bacterium]MDQ1673498.1 diacylglycerol O-acyltransferase / wax synthase [Frankiaceae bacterium]
MAIMPLTQAMFLLLETRDQPMHVGSLQLFRPPEGSGPEFLREMYEDLLDRDEMSSLFRKRAHRSPLTLGQWAWEDDELIDLEHHVRHSALPHPGRIRELLALVSRLHASLLDRSRPLWEAHLIEGLNDGRYAVYTKMHHALMDGVSAAKLMERSLSTDPDVRDLPPPWAPRSRRPRKSPAGGGLLGIPRAALGVTSDFVGLGPAVLKRAAEQALRQQAVALPLQAPRSMFNVAITGSRRFAAQSWPMESFKAVAKASGSTLNDVLLAVCSGALRKYLIEQDALPSHSLVAMTPVSLRADDDDAEDAGVNVGTLLCTLGTDIEDPAKRMSVVRESMNAGKEAMKGLTQLQVTALSAATMAPLAVQSLVDPGGYTRPAYNLVISNVPGPKEPLYFNGAKLEGSYPLSIPHHGQAMNITVTSYNGNLEFGIVGCRRTVPRLQRLLTFLDESLQELTESVGA